MPKRSPHSSTSVREPVQVYLAADDRDLLNRLAAETGLSKAEILRRGVRSFAREQHGAAGSPMLRFVSEMSASETGAPDGVAVDHDAVLAEAYRTPGRKRR